MEGLSELFSFQWASDGGPVSLQEAGLRLVLAIVLSAGVGIDRELKHKPLGLRTNMLVALGAASFSLMACSWSTSWPAGRRRSRSTPAA